MELTNHYTTGQSIWTNEEDGKYHRRFYSFITPESQATNFTTNKNFRASFELMQSNEPDAHYVATVFLENVVTIGAGEVGTLTSYGDPFGFGADSFNTKINNSDYETLQNTEIVNNIRVGMMKHRNKFDYIQKYYGAQAFRYRTNENADGVVDLTANEKFTFITPLSLWLGPIFDKFPTNLYKRIQLDCNLISDVVNLSNHMKIPAVAGLSNVTMAQRIIIQYVKVFIPSPKRISFGSCYYQSKLYPIVYNASLFINITVDFARSKFLNAIYLNTLVQSHTGGLNTLNSFLSGSWRDLNLLSYRVLEDGSELYRTSTTASDGLHVEMLNFDEWRRHNRDNVPVENTPDTSVWSTNKQPFMRIDIKQIFQSLKSGDAYVGHSSVSDLTKAGKLELQLDFGAVLPGTSLLAGHVLECIVESTRLCYISECGEGANVSYTR